MWRRRHRDAATRSCGGGEYGAKLKLRAGERASLLGDEDRRQRPTTSQAASCRTPVTAMVEPMITPRGEDRRVGGKEAADCVQGQFTVVCEWRVPDAESTRF